MIEYPKIQSVFKRDEKTHKFILGNFSLPEFEFLKDNKWVWTEKIDGTNIRVIWKPYIGGTIWFKGKTDNAQIPDFLITKLQEIFPSIDNKLLDIFPETEVCLYGEGYGAKIQKGGGNYIPNGVNFILFDVLIGNWWLKRDGIEDVANKLGLHVVPIVGQGTLNEATEFTKSGYTSTFGNFLAEGIVLKPEVELLSRKRDRIITKMKFKDF